MRIFLCVILFGFFVGLAQADTVTLKSGKVLEGIVKEKTDTYIILNAGKKDYKIKFRQMAEESIEKYEMLKSKTQAPQVPTALVPIIGIESLPGKEDFDEKLQRVKSLQDKYVKRAQQKLDQEKTEDMAMLQGEEALSNQLPRRFKGHMKWYGAENEEGDEEIKIVLDKIGKDGKGHIVALGRGVFPFKSEKELKIRFSYDPEKKFFEIREKNLETNQYYEDEFWQGRMGSDLRSMNGFYKNRLTRKQAEIILIEDRDGVKE